MVRSVLSVVAGYIVSVAVIIASFGVIGYLFPEWFLALGFTEPPGMTILIVSLAFSIVAAVPAEYVTALLAKRKEMKHAIALAVIMLLLGIVSWSFEGGIKPVWWYLGLFSLGPGGVLVGARLKLKR